LKVREKKREQELQQLPSGKIRILECLSRGPKTNAEIHGETGLSGPVISGHLKSMAANDLILSPPKIQGLQRSERGGKYEITPKGREQVICEEDRKFGRDAPFFRTYDLDPQIFNTPSLEDTHWRTPEHMREVHQLFPFTVRGTIRLSRTAKSLIEDWAEITQEMYEGKEKTSDKESWYRSAVRSFTDPTIRTLAEVIMQRTKSLCYRYSKGESKAPTLDTIVNFDFEFLCRYEGEKMLESATREQRDRAKHILAAMILLQMADLPRETILGYGCDFWDREELQALVQSGLLTQEEIQPLLEACDACALGDGKGGSLGVTELTPDQVKRIMESFFRRAELARQATSQTQSA
jgi:DNA-binding MarR family transcriptional regulator